MQGIYKIYGTITFSGDHDGCCGLFHGLGQVLHDHDQELQEEELHDLCHEQEEELHDLCHEQEEEPCDHGQCHAK